LLSDLLAYESNKGVETDGEISAPLLNDGIKHFVDLVDFIIEKRMLPSYPEVTANHCTMIKISDIDPEALENHKAKYKVARMFETQLKNLNEGIENWEESTENSGTRNDWSTN